MNKDDSKKKVTVNAIVDDLIGGAMTGLGVAGGAVAMKMASTKVNPWLVSGLGLLAGFGTRILANNIDNAKMRASVKDIGSGVIAAASLDLGIKAGKQFNLIPASWTDKLPALSGREESRTVPGFYGDLNASDLLNGLGNYQPAEVISSSLLD